MCVHHSEKTIDKLSFTFYELWTGTCRPRHPLMIPQTACSSRTSTWEWLRTDYQMHYNMLACLMVCFWWDWSKEVGLIQIDQSMASSPTRRRSKSKMSYSNSMGWVYRGWQNIHWKLMWLIQGTAVATFLQRQIQMGGGRKVGTQ